MAAENTKAPVAAEAVAKNIQRYDLKTQDFSQGHIATFTEAMRYAGINLAAEAHIVPDGQLHRARAADDKPGQLSVWYNFHPDAPASGIAGNWRTGARLKWCSKRLSTLSVSERAEITRRFTENRKRSQAEQQARYRNAAERALKIWAASTPAAPQHPYLDRKSITPGIARQSGPSLVLPVVDFAGALQGLQFIQPDGQKRYISGMAKAGHFIPTGGLPDGTRPLYISEGVATAATLAAMKPDACHIAALDCGNLASVAKAARAKWPGLVIVVCPDFDKVGRKKAQQAAISARCLILPPPAVIPPHCSDWNDIQAARRQGWRHDLG